MVSQAGCQPSGGYNIFVLSWLDTSSQGALRMVRATSLGDLLDV